MNNQFEGLNLPPAIVKLLQNWKKVLMVIIVIVLAWSGFFQVEPEEVGIITRFGKYTRRVEPGLNFKIPVIEKITKVPVERQQKLEFGFRTINAGVRSQYTREGYRDESVMLTGDLNLGDVEWVVQYRINDPYKFLVIV